MTGDCQVRFCERLGLGCPGRLTIGETPENALQRELFEETSISLSTNVQVLYLGKLYIRKPGIDYVYHAFQVVLKEELPIFLSEEHVSYRWVSIDEAKTLRLVDGAEEALDFYLVNSEGKRGWT